MTSLAILDELRDLDVRLEVDGDRLVVDAPKAVMSDEMRARLREHKAELLAVLLDQDSLRAIEERRNLWGDGPCYVCGGGLFWHRRGSPLVCANCHPPAVPGIVYRRLRLESVEDAIERVN